MDKRGSHVGMILSFVLFVTTLIFLYDVIRPVTQTNEEKEKWIEQIRMSLEKELQRELTSSTIRVDTQGNSDKCVKLNYSKFAENLSEEHIAKFISGEAIESKVEGEFVILKNVSEPLRIFFAKGLKEETFEGSTQECNSADGSGQSIQYTFTTSKKEYYFEEDLINLLNELKEEENYTRIKEKFLLPKDAEFNLIITMNGERNGTEKEANSPNVFIKQYPISYVNSSADVNSGFFDISVW